MSLDLSDVSICLNYGLLHWDNKPPPEPMLKNKYNSYGVNGASELTIKDTWSI